MWRFMLEALQVLKSILVRFILLHLFNLPIELFVSLKLLVLNSLSFYEINLKTASYLVTFVLGAVLFYI